MSLFHRIVNRRINLILFLVVIVLYSMFIWKYKQIHVLTPDIQLLDNEIGVLKAPQNVIFDLGAKEGHMLLDIFGIASTNQENDIVSRLNHNYIHENKWIVHAFEANDLFDDQLEKVKKDV